MRFTTIIPVYNERKTIAETLRRIAAYCALTDWDWEILVCDDGSADSTPSIVREIIAKRGDGRIRLLQASRNTGKGDAVRRGVAAAGGDVILFTDADLSSPMKESAKLLAALEGGAGIAIGSRALRSPGADVQQSVKRRIAGRIFNALVRLIALGGYHDTQCGFKAFRRDTAKKLFGEQTLDGFGFDVEILLLARRHRIPVAEVPVMWRQGQQTRVRLLRDSLRMLGELFYLRRTYRDARQAAPVPLK